MQRQKHSDKRLDQRLEEQEQETGRRGIFELFDRDEDAPLARDDQDDEKK